MQSRYDYLTRFTETYRKYSGNIFEQEVACLRVQYPHILRPVRSGDCFAGRIAHEAVGFGPQMGDGFAYYLKEKQFQEILQNPDWTPAQRSRLDALYTFWRTEQTAVKTREAYSTELASVLQSDNWAGESGIGFPLYRMSGTHLDYDKLLSLGIPGLRQSILEKMKAKADPEALQFYHGLISILALLSEVCIWYAKQIDEMSQTTREAARKDELGEMAAVLRRISERKPESLREGIQLMFLTSLLSGSVNYGRMDVYLGDLLARDLESGRLTEAEALRLIKSLWVMMAERESESEGHGYWRFDSRVIVGGSGRRNEPEADRFALLAMEAIRETGDIIPQLTLRFYEGQNPVLMEKAIDILAGGNPYPMLYNDDVNIPAAAYAFQVSREEATECIPFGCGEAVLNHRSVGTPSGVINLLQALLVTLHRGVDPTTGKTMGMPADAYGPWDNFDSLLSDYHRQVERMVGALAEQETLEYQLAGQTAPFLFFSLLYDDCIERGRAIFRGGVRYLGGTLETYGNTNTADSLLAIRKAVFEDQLFTMEQLVAMLNADFQGFERERKLLEDLPKYGNDLDEADELLVEVDRHVCTVTRNQAKRTGLHSYLVVIINNHANTLMGRYTAASPDGRPAFSPMNNGNTPSSGNDRSGVTAFLNSIVKPDPALHAGATQNMKFTKDLLNRHRDQFKAMMDAYWAQGGAQAMLTVVSRGALENAMENPAKYQNLMVRVGGFSARFVELDRDVQEEILSRTLY